MMQVPDDYMKTVVFLCLDKPNGLEGVVRTPCATGFFVRVPLDTKSSNSIDYVVTARHSIEEPMACGYEQLFVRINLRKGGYTEITTKLADWILHDSADVAAIPILRSAFPKGFVPYDLAQASLTLSDFVGPPPEYKFEGETPFGKVSIQPRVGHQIYFLGLFTQNYGEERNLPIARFGNIARMPDLLTIERPGRVTASITAYLAEFHSWGGHSGSPTFFMYPFVLDTRDEAGEKLLGTDLMWMSGFMGLITGHYYIPEEAQTTGDILGTVATNLNSGIAMLTPAAAVTELLMRPDLVTQRKEILEKVKKQRPPVALDLGIGS